MQAKPHYETTRNEANIEKLQECLRGELSAVETYEMALKNVSHVGLHGRLQELLASHARRADRLRDRVEQLGAEPSRSSGIWGAFAKVFQAGADLLGDRAAIAALEEGEDHALKLYTDRVDGCDADTRRLLATELMPEQRRTHDLCKALKTYAGAPS